MYNEQVSPETLKALARQRRDRKLKDNTDLTTRVVRNKKKYDRTKDRRNNKVRDW